MNTIRKTLRNQGPTQRNARVMQPMTLMERLELRRRQKRTLERRVLMLVAFIIASVFIAVVCR